LKSSPLRDVVAFLSQIPKPLREPVSQIDPVFER
jgi:hypothetical protein